MIRKIQDYLLVRYPLIWQSKFIPMLLAGMAGWLVAFGWGYVSTNINTLKEINLYSYYTHYFLSLHAILGIILYVVWALYFFRTNPLFQFYPLRKYYLVLLYVQIVIPFLLILTLYYPFTYGSFMKAKNILSEKELRAESKIINEAFPFLVTDLELFKLSNRVYPDPFPLRDFHREDNDTGWAKEDVYFNPRFIEGKFDTSNNFYHPPVNAGFTTVDGHEYLFYKAHTYSEFIDSCSASSYTIIDSFYLLGAALKINYSAVQNCSSTFLTRSTWYQEGEVFRSDKSTKEENYYRSNIAPVIYPWIINEESDSIFRCIESLKSICKKYGIHESIPTKELVDTLIHNHFKLENSLIYNGAYFNTDVVSNERMGYIALNDFEMIFSNYAEALETNFNIDVFLVLLCIALGMAMIVLIAFSIDFISILISIPVTGVIFIFCGFLAASHVSNRSELSLWYFFIAVGVMVAGYFAVIKPGLSKRRTSVLLALGFYSLPFIASLGLNLLQKFTEESVYKCGQWQTIYHYRYNALHVISVFLLLLVLYIPLLKKLRAKEE